MEVDRGQVLLGEALGRRLYDAMAWFWGENRLGGWVSSPETRRLFAGAARRFRAEILAEGRGPKLKEEPKPLRVHCPDAVEKVNAQAREMVAAMNKPAPSEDDELGRRLYSIFTESGPSKDPQPWGDDSPAEKGCFIKAALRFRAECVGPYVKAIEDLIWRRYRIRDCLTYWMEHAADDAGRRNYHYVIDQLMEKRLLPYDSEKAKDEIKKVLAVLSALPDQGEAGEDEYRVPQDETSGLSAIIGKWPGDETDEQIKEALKDKPSACAGATADKRVSEEELGRAAWGVVMKMAGAHPFFVDVGAAIRVELARPGGPEGA